MPVSTCFWPYCLRTPRSSIAAEDAAGCSLMPATCRLPPGGASAPSARRTRGSRQRHRRRAEARLGYDGVLEELVARVGVLAGAPVAPVALQLQRGDDAGFGDQAARDRLLRERGPVVGAERLGDRVEQFARRELELDQQLGERFGAWAARRYGRRDAALLQRECQFLAVESDVHQARLAHAAEELEHRQQRHAL